MPDELSEPELVHKLSAMKDPRVAELYRLAYQIAATTPNPDSEEMHLAASVEALISDYFRRKSVLENPGEASTHDLLDSVSGFRAAMTLGQVALTMNAATTKAKFNMGGKRVLVQVNVREPKKERSGASTKSAG